MSESICDQRSQAAAYLLGALEQAETGRYREHLQSCESCQREVDELRLAAHELATTPTLVEAPHALIQRVMENVRAEAELLDAAGPQADRPVTHTGRRWRPRLVLPVAAATVAAAAVVAAILAAGSARSPERVTRALLAANTPGHAQVRQDGTRAELLVTGIPSPPAGEIYEVWLAKPHQAPQPTDALFSVDARGNASVDVPGNLRDVTTLMVTVEPAGGSRHPTNPPIMTAKLGLS